MGNYPLTAVVPKPIAYHRVSRESRFSPEVLFYDARAVHPATHLLSMGNYQLRNSGNGPLLLSLGLAACMVLCSCASTQPVPHATVDSNQATAPVIQPGAAQQARSAAAAQPPAEQRRSQQLVAQVERAFRSGEAHYRKGQLVQAKVDFDSAVDLMLASGIDIKADPLLDDEFNRVVDAVNALEMDALKRGNGFAPNVEPSPADVANDVTFEVDPNLVATAKAELATTKSDLPLVINDYVAAFINFFANTQRGHNTLMHSFQRAGRYKAMIQRVLKEEGVPQDLIYLAVAESSFQPQAVNGHSGAGGMWQFMPHGNYGLTRNGYVDERFDPEKSTRAYARYMKFNYTQLGDWYLAMAGYNWGAGNVQRAVQKTGYADFWELYKRNNLPGETKNYVPEILAAIIIANNPKQYGFEGLQSDPAIVTDNVTIDYPVDLRLVADVVDAQPQELLALNPSLLRLTTPPASALAEPFTLHLPPGTASLYQQRIVAVPEDRRTQWRYHRVTREDTLATVARGFHLTAAQLATVNQLQADDSLDSIEALVVPVPLASAPSTRAEVYKARKGDSLITIADRFGVSLDDLHRWNHIAGSNVTAGQKIRVTEPVRLAPRSKDRTHRGRAAGTGRKDAVSPNEKSANIHARHRGGRSTGKSGNAEKPVGKGAAHISENSESKKSKAKSATRKSSVTPQKQVKKASKKNRNPSVEK